MERSISRKAVALDAKTQLIQTPTYQASEKTLKKLEKEKNHFERHFIIGIITSTEFCKWACEVYDNSYLESSTARTMMAWVKEYYQSYQQAPGRDIEAIYYEKLKQGLNTDLAEEIEEDILPGLSREYEESDQNIEYLKARSVRRINEVQARRTISRAEESLKANDLEEANSLLGLDPPSNTRIDNFCRTISQMKTDHVKPPRLLIKPWLREGQTNFIYGRAGVGKSLLALLVSYIAGLKNYFDVDLAEWQVSEPTGCLYIDGELGESEMVERIEQFRWIGPQNPDHEIKTFSIPEYQLSTGKPFDLSKREDQRQIIDWFRRNPAYKLLVIDSVSTVFNLESENDNSEWNKKVNSFLKDLRALKVAHIIIHHAGKNDKMRGASAMEAMANNIFSVKDHPNKEKGEAWFLVDNSEKQRSAGKGFDRFAIRFTKDGKDTIFEITDTKYSDPDKEHKYYCIVAALVAGEPRSQIAERFKCSGENISYYKNNAKRDGYLDAKGNPTKAGKQLQEEMRSKLNPGFWDDDTDLE